MMPPTKTYCRICEAACGLTFEDGALRPDKNHPVSRGFVCAKGTRFNEVAQHPSRLRDPMIRVDGALRRAGWSEAIEAAAAKLRPVMDRHGPHAVGIYIGNPLAFSSFGQLAALFFSRALGTRNVFTAGTQDCNNKFAAAALMHGSPALQPIPDFEHTDLAVLFGTNPAVSQSSFVHLEGGASIFDRMKKRGAEMIWVDVRETESAARWGELVAVRPGTDVWLIFALLGLLANGAPNDKRVEGLDRLLELARTITPARAAAITGVSEQAIRDLASKITSAPSVALHMSVGVNQGPFGTLAYVGLQALAFVTGNYDRRGGSIFSALGAQGARMVKRMGLFTRTDRSRIGNFPTVFECLPAGILADEILTGGAEQIRAMIVIAGDPLRSIPGTGRLQEAFSKLETVVCLDLFESEAGRHADVLLPASSWLERADFALPGMLLQTVDLLQTSAAVHPRFHASRPDHEAIAMLALELGRPLFGSRLLTRLLATEGLIDRVVPALTEFAWRAFDADPSRRGYGIRIPRPRPGSYLGRGPMTPDNKVRFWDSTLEPEWDRLMAWVPPSDGFVLLGRRRRIGHNSWLHAGARDAPPAHHAKSQCVAWLSATDMSELGLEDGSTITLETAQGKLSVPAKAKRGVLPGTVVFPHGEPGANVNELLPSGPSYIEPLSGMLLMTGTPVEVSAETQPTLVSPRV